MNKTMNRTKIHGPWAKPWTINQGLTLSTPRSSWDLEFRRLFQTHAHQFHHWVIMFRCWQVMMDLRDYVMMYSRFPRVIVSQCNQPLSARPHRVQWGSHHHLPQHNIQHWPIRGWYYTHWPIGGQYSGHVICHDTLLQSWNRTWELAPPKALRRPNNVEM